MHEDTELSIQSLIMAPAAAKVVLLEPSKLSLKKPNGGGNQRTRMEEVVIGGGEVELEMERGIALSCVNQLVI